MVPAARAHARDGNGQAPYTGNVLLGELTSTDQAAAKAFYGALFGWEADDRPVGEGSFYSMQSIAGRQVAAIAPQPQQQRDAGVPPLWNSYVWVDSADEVAERAGSSARRSTRRAFDVMQAGRMAVIQDPQGAYFMLWQPREHSGAGLVNAPGALVWNELQSPDLDGSSAFYGDLFGWKVGTSQGMEDRLPGDQERRGEQRRHARAERRPGCRRAGSCTSASRTSTRRSPRWPSWAA